ncbi:type VII secretion target [Saccharomonospora sp.]|uniref:type VII secretion target n=1 Tax=Saccharomonospora sp. TaxID=33913 RepID=UPI00261251D7|nr:type VII secretion target [Saccharomonospora sp.]
MPNGGGHHVEPAELRGCADLLGQQADHLAAIGRHATEKGGDTSGYTGLLALLAPVVTGVVGLYADTLDFASGKMGEVRDNLLTAADTYEARDEASKAEMDRLGSLVDGAGDVTVGSA